LQFEIPKILEANVLKLARDKTFYCRSSWSLPAHATLAPHFTVSTKARAQSPAELRGATCNEKHSTYLGPSDIPPYQPLQWIQTVQSQWRQPHHQYGDGFSAS